MATDVRRTRHGGRRRGNKTLRVGVVGLGYWGPNLVRNLVELKGVEIAYLCDLRPQVLKSIATRYPDVPCTTSYRKVLADRTVDAIALATPVSTHTELAAAALKAGKHTFVEKPLASSSAQALELMRLAERENLVLMPGHTFVYSPPVATIKGLIDKGELGDIYFISMSRVNLGLHQPDASVVWDLGPHDFSILSYWLGELPSQVSALSRSCLFPGTPDVAFINLTYPSGTVVHVELSWLAPTKLRRTAIVGSEKMVVYDDTSNESVRIYDSGASLPDPESFGEYRLTYRTGAIVSPRVDATEPLSLELQDFCDAIRKGTPLRSSPQLGVDVIRAIEAVDSSLAAGGAPVALEGASATLGEALVARVLEVTSDTAEESAHPAGPPAPASGEESGSIGTAILGAGPAGLTAAHVLALRGASGAVFEADGKVGGIAKTVEFNGFRFDLGGHRFFTKLGPIQRLWEQTMGEDFLTRPRLSRIYYDGKFFSYPLKARDVVGRLGVFESTRCALSYIWAKRDRKTDPKTFEEWVTSRFGKRLYEAFFRSYTEKVWGIPGSEIRSQWAAQRIKNFSLGYAILSLLGIGRSDITTLIESFRYPRLGPGQLWERLEGQVRAAGVAVHLNERCVVVNHDSQRVGTVVIRSNGDLTEHAVDHLLSTIPLKDLILSLDPPPPDEVLEAAAKLRYRELCLVALMTTEAEPFPDNWIYLHDPGTRAGRVQNYGAWSSAMVKPGTTCLGVEYFCFEGDEIWEMSDEQAVQLATSELARIGLLDPTKVFDGVKVRVPKAYPMYDAAYEDAVATIRAYLDRFENLQTCGRNGLHRYNNQDHSMWTAILATLNLLEGAEYDVWGVNVEAEYLEEGELVQDLLVGAQLEAIDLPSVPVGD